MGETEDKAEKAKNGPKEMMAYFGSPERPVTMAEFREFWGSLSEEEKDEFRYADLS